MRLSKQNKSDLIGLIAGILIMALVIVAIFHFAVWVVNIEDTTSKFIITMLATCGPIVLAMITSNKLLKKETRLEQKNGQE